MYVHQRQSVEQTDNEVWIPLINYELTEKEYKDSQVGKLKGTKN